MNIHGEMGFLLLCSNSTFNYSTMTNQIIRKAPLICTCLLATWLGSGCGSKTEKATPSGLKVQLSNSLDKDRKEIITMDLNTLDESVRSGIQIGNTEIEGHQIESLDSDKDNVADVLVIKSSLSPKENIELDITGNWTEIKNDLKRTQAELSIRTGGSWVERKYEGGTEFVNVDRLRVPDAHTDHSYFIRYEGPGWENEMIGYRFYLDWRNAIDIFGKKVDTLVLQTVGQDGFDSYHEPANWGMDILKAGKSLGIGSIGQLIDENVEHFQNTDSVICQVANAGYICSAVETDYYGWATSANQINLKSRLEIFTGDRAVRHTLTLSEPIENFCTGIVKNEKAQKIESIIGANGWAYLATYGPQSLADDNLGLAILFNTKDVDRISDGEHDHLIVFKPATQVQYYLLGAWEQEPNGIQNQEEFKQYLNSKIEKLNNPIEVALVN